MENTEQQTEKRELRDQMRPDEQGFMLLGLIVAISLILLALSVAATRVAFSLRREREVESARRADQYVRAIRKFYLKNQHYPGSIEQLEKTNNVRYLRQKYVDPLSGQDYRLIPVGQNKTTVKGFFGQPLTGIASAGLGSAAGIQSAGVGGPTSPAGGVGGVGGAGGLGGTSGLGGTTGAGGATGVAGTPGATSATTPGGTASPFGSSGFGTGLPGSGSGPFMGVGSSATGSSILVPNEQTTYETWEFLYDPRIELLKAKAALNGGLGSAGAGSLGQTPGASGFGSPMGTGTTGTGTTGTGTTGGAQPTKP